MWSVRLPDSSFQIWYVGQTIRSFRQRLLEERRWDVNENHLRLDLGAYARGRMVRIEGCHLTAKEYFDQFYRTTELFFVPMNDADSPLFEARRRRPDLFKPAESAILRELRKNQELWRFTWNSIKRGVEMDEPRYPCTLDCPESIRGLKEKIDDA